MNGMEKDIKDINRESKKNSEAPRTFSRRLVAALVGTALFSTLLLPGLGTEPYGIAMADELTKARQDHNQVQQQINNTRRELEQRKREERTILGRLDIVKREISQTERAIYELGRQMDVVEKQIGQAQKELEEAQKRHDEQLELLKMRMRDMYINGNVSYVEVLLEATHIVDFLTRLDLMEKIVEQDAKLIRQIEAEERAIAAHKANLEVRKNELSELKQNAEAERRRLNEQSQEHQQLLEEVTSQKEVVEQMLDDLERTSRQLESMIRNLQLQQNRAAMGTGPMAFPLPQNARVTSPYGGRIHPVLKTSRFHTGVDFAASTGTPILASQTGIVIFAGSSGGYGNTVILDHGGGTSTLYAHMSVIGVREGQTVQKGERIGAVGSTGWSTGPHLHFEVRQNGQHVNPMPYIGR
ncbi:peptidoglycan DD-metalloendopeptidase family protein [Heliorestis acidaminivorans]|uniref:Peptidoglycan DD-metalloendopeptidase family protein n=1 Tax=Heliorestis acidaminivorans TaxID=553427 RepID=A0A6I0EX61_9FIRM|nr:peptidoglycan DD-metalloendopeptidase family protein [Heliorestis acidaminivorans]KAB2950992.1 peptidoglycan DD-metalloendopeptidase family protein [Heliorestis acidaminivorans]